MIFLLLLLAILIFTPIIISLLLNNEKEKKEKIQGEAEDINEKKVLIEKDMLAQRVDLRIWDALNTKFGIGRVVSYQPMRSYTEGGDLDIVVTFADGTSGIYRAYLPLCKIRGCERKNLSDDYRKKPSEWANQKSDMDRITEFIQKGLENGKPFLIPHSLYENMDENELAEELLYNELADTVDVLPGEGIRIIKSKIV